MTYIKNILKLPHLTKINLHIYTKCNNICTLTKFVQLYKLYQKILPPQPIATFATHNQSAPNRASASTIDIKCVKCGPKMISSEKYKKLKN